MTRPTLTLRDWAVITAVNGIWLSGYAAWLWWWPDPVRIAIVAGAVALAPGAAWDWLWPRRSRALGAHVSRVLMTSAVALLLALVAFRLLNVLPTQGNMWVTMAALSNLGLVLCWRHGRRLAAPRSITHRERVAAGLVLAAVLWATTVVATRVVPPLPDHDLEMQGTGFSLLTRLEPRLITDRGLHYYFAHPPLLHVYIAASFLYHGEVSALQAYDTLTTIADIDATFAHAPHLRETRTPNIGFAAVTAALLLLWTFRRSRRWWLSTLVVAAYLSNPEVVVRSAYGGYFMFSTLALLLMVMVMGRGGRTGVSAGLGLWAVWGNHKIIVGVAGIVLGCVAAARRTHSTVRLGAALAGGAVVGTALFWTYGYLIAPQDFVTDHLGHHLWQRVIHANPLGYGGYPSLVGLWREFVVHTGLVLLPAGLLFAATDLGRPPAHEIAGRTQSWVLTGVILVTAVVFSVIDWRMTKHLMPMVLALHMVLTPTRHAAAWRVAAAAATCLWLLVWNIPVVAGLVRDFAGFTITPAW
jgi:hypothetical protein